MCGLRCGATETIGHWKHSYQQGIVLFTELQQLHVPLIQRLAIGHTLQGEPVLISCDDFELMRIEQRFPVIRSKYLVRLKVAV